MLGHAPDGADDRLWGVVRVLGRALKGRIFAVVGAVDQALAEMFPAIAKPIGSRQREGVLRQVRGAGTDEAKKLLLLIAGCCAAGVFDLLRKRDGPNIVERPTAPTARQYALAVEPVILPRSDPRRGLGGIDARRRFDGRIYGLGWGGARGIEGPAKGRRVEQAEAVLRSICHQYLRGGRARRHPLERTGSGRTG